MAGVVGSVIDNRLFGPGPVNQQTEGPRMDNLQVQSLAMLINKVGPPQRSYGLSAPI